MFATLSMGLEDQVPDILESNTNPPGQKPQHSACDACRDKKLKCSGRREGCDRCQRKEIPCIYLLCEVNRRQKKRNRVHSSAERTSPPSMPPSHANCDPNGEASKSTNHVAVLSDEASPSMSMDLNVERLPDAANVLSPFRDTQRTFVPSDLMGDMNTLDSLDPLLAGIGTEKFPRPLAFDFSGGDDLNIFADTNLMSGLATPSNEMPTDGLDIDFGMAPLESIAEIRQSADHLPEISALCKPSPKTSASMPATDYTIMDVNVEGSSFDPLLMLRTPLTSALQQLAPQRASEENLRMHERRQTNVPNMSSPRNDITTISCAADINYDKPSTSSLSCQCMQKVLVLYEDVETKRNGDMVSSTDYRLSFQNSVLDQCIGLLRCIDCRRMSGFVTLLITVCERLMSSFQRISATCSEKLRHHQQWQRRADSCKNLRMKLSDGDEDAGGKQRVSVGGYRIESPQEQYCLVLTVIELQLKEFRGLLMWLNDISIKSGCERHTLMLRPIDDEMQDILTKLRRARNDTLDEKLHMLPDLDSGSTI